MNVSRKYKSYLLTVLLLLLAFNLTDRFALGVVLQEIKVDLALTDTELGFMSGIAFAAFYALMGLPIARWADRGNRVTIISLTAALWSLAVAACGLARNFVQLLLIRVGVAVGESGGVVPSFSLLSDYFGRPERPRALAIYQLGAPLSLILGYLLAGWLDARYGWRIMFVLLGLPGLVLAVLVRLTLREPRSESASVPLEVSQPTVKEVCAALWTNVTFRHLLICISVTFFFMYGILQWQPTYFIRSYGFTSERVSVLFAAVYGFGSLVGTYVGGAWASRYAGRNERLQLKAVGAAMAGSAVVAVSSYMSTKPDVTLILMVGLMLAQTAINGPLYATVQTLVPERMRAMATATVLLFANLIGMGLGPLATGALSDAFQPFAGQESLRYALIVLAPGLLWPAWHALRASRTVTQDLEHTQGS